MTEREADSLASRAAACPFCGEFLVAKSDHHGWWVAHRNEPGECFDSTIQLQSERDLSQWNTRPRGMFHQRTKVAINLRLGWHRDNLDGWKEPDGYLLPTEPDLDERCRVRDRLRVAIEVLEELKRELGLE